MDYCVLHTNRMDRLDAFATFAAVADAGGFAPAARKLGRSPAAVTRSVAALEAELGAQLFRRTTRVVTLTEEGARFLVSAKRILADTEVSMAGLREGDAALRGNLVVTASVMFGNLYIAPLLLAFLRRHPQVRARSFLSDRVVDLVAEGIDVAVRIAHLKDSSLRAAKVGAVRRVLVASPAYLAARGTPQRVSDLREHDTIAFSFDEAPREWVFAGGRRSHRVAIDPRLVANSTETTLRAAAAGRGITRALSYQVASDVRAGRLVVLLPELEPPPVPIHVVHAAGAEAPARVRAFVDFAVAKLRADERLDPKKWIGA
jgi:DNA-binding transcriptional LysR family regulator